MVRARAIFVTTVLLLACLYVQAQRFYNLTAQDIRVDSVLPRFSCAIPLTGQFQDSIYTVSILYPEFDEMTSTDIARYQTISGLPLPPMPVLTQQWAMSRGEGELIVSFCPLVYRDGKYQALVSFMLQVQAAARKKLPATTLSSASTRATAATVATQTGTGIPHYADHSVLHTGRWVKIRVKKSGVYQLTPQLIRKAGFTDLTKVRVFGYGGALQNEELRHEELTATDDLQEVPLCVIGDRRLFRGQGAVSWPTDPTAERIRNPYSDYGYYFLTQDDTAPLTIDSLAFHKSLQEHPDAYHWLRETDNFAWYHGGRNLFENDPIAVGTSREYTLPTFPSGTHHPQLTLALTAGTASCIRVSYDNTTLGEMNIYLSTYDKGNRSIVTYPLPTDDTGGKKLTLTTLSGGPVHPDFLQLAFDAPYPISSLATTPFPEPEYVSVVPNQDRHADGPADMVILVPSSGKLLEQAQRLKTMHETQDGMRVHLVTAAELYNEFSSGTPDANAYRRYMKMLYDRASSSADMPRYLLLFGDGVWDNRMRTSDTQMLAPDDYLLCYESENSFNEISCYVDDGFFCMLDEGEGGNPLYADKLDVAVGRLPVTTAEAAKGIVDKLMAYTGNQQAGAWHNTLVFMGDDGDQNRHMADTHEAATMVETLYPDFGVHRIMWDAYRRESTANGNSYPEVSALIKQWQNNGALVMDYSGHGRAEQLSHERVLDINDFEQFRGTRLPLWISASCDIMAFDGVTPTLGETAVCNAHGGAIAFFGTARTVQTYYNKQINKAYLRHLLAVNNGVPTSIGEAMRLAKNEMITSGADLTTNKLQYTLLGDPALVLHRPLLKAHIDSVNGKRVDTATDTLKAGSVARITGYVEGQAFEGIVTATVYDAAESIVCQRNAPLEADTAFVFTDRSRILFVGSDSVRDNRFSVSFPIPYDISYADAPGLIRLHAVNNTHTLEAQGSFNQLVFGGNNLPAPESAGPTLYCYLNSPSFSNGGKVNTTPYFVAEIQDEDGINATGNGIGHDLLLTIDEDMNKTYVLNDHFTYDFGTYTRGTTYFQIPTLAPGKHRLQFRAWDANNNPSVTSLDFYVVEGLAPNLLQVDVSKNPATNSTTFILTHDRTGSEMDVELEVFDMSGRQLWIHKERGVISDGAYTYDWNLTLDNGSRLTTGIYLYRASIASEGSRKVSQAKKLIVTGNK